MGMEQFNELVRLLHKIRPAFEMQVEASALEVTEIAKQISSSIGEISLNEAKDVIIREFEKRIREEIIVG